MPDGGLRRWLLLWLSVLFLRSAWAAEPVSPALLLAETYRTGSVDVSRYLVSEKLDGVRAYWDGQQLLTRSGNTIHAPQWFIDALPRHPLDGELWMGRGQFEATSAAVRRETPDASEWRKLYFMLFELPEAVGDFAARAGSLRTVVRQANAPWLQAIAQLPVENARTLNRRLREVVEAGGEGLMLHRADAPYVTGRSDALLKMKPRLDAEGVVVAHLPGKGRNAGVLGALRVRTRDGKEFSLGAGFTDTMRQIPPPIGTTITYRYHGLTAAGLPRFASFWRLRPAE